MLKKINYLILIVLLLFVSGSQAKVIHRGFGGAPTVGGTSLSVDSTSTFVENETNTDPWTWSHTTSASANLMVIQCFVNYDTTFDQVDYNSDVASETVDVQHSTITQLHIASFELSNPDEGTNTVTVDLGIARRGACVARTYIGANASDPVSNPGSNEQDATALDCPITITCGTGDQALYLGALDANRTVTPSDDVILNTESGSRPTVAQSKDDSGTALDMTWVSDVEALCVAVCVED